MGTEELVDKINTSETTIGVGRLIALAGRLAKVGNVIGRHALEETTPTNKELIQWVAELSVAVDTLIGSCPKEFKKDLSKFWDVDHE